MKRLPGRAIVAHVKSGTLGSRVHRKNLFVLAVVALVVAGLTSVAGAAPVPALALHPALQTGVGNRAPQLQPCPADEIEDGGEPAPVQPQRPSQEVGSLAAPSFQLVAATDTGISNSDRLTGNNMPSFEGQAPAGSTVALFADGSLTGVATADDQGNWSYMLNECQALDDGGRAITAQAFDDAGQVSALSPELTVTILTSAPDMPVIGTVLANSHAKGGRLVVSGTAVPGTTIKVMEGRAVRARAQADAGGAWSATVGGLAAGPHTLRANATDAAGNESPAFNDTVVTVDQAGAASSGGPAAADMTAVTAATTSAGASTASATTTPGIAMAAGDIACGTGSSGAACKQQATANILLANNPDVVMPLGDNQYECGLLGDFQKYYDPSWGALKAKTYPSVGNHEYLVSTSTTNPCYKAPSGAAGYFTYFGSAATPLQPTCTSGCKGYYSYDLPNVPGWHFIVLNTNCSKAGGCGLGSPQETWLKNDLAAHPTACTVAYWHHPRYSSGYSGTSFVSAQSALWQDLYNGGTDLILNGHDHDYERFAPMNANGKLDTAHGIREIIVGTGGRNHTKFSSTVLPTSQVRDATSYGALKLTLGSGSYSWQFIPISGQTFTDSGTEACR